MRMYDVIRNKRMGKALTPEEIHYFISGYTDGSIPDYQASALCMAICFQGMDDAEIACLTGEMAHSGDTVDLSRFGDKTVDKHSTGGVGDKTSLIVAPIMATLGAKMAKMSGRGLGHTGGTVDKLESIPGYNTALPIEDFLTQVENVGVAVIGQTGNLTPADKKLYALRDVTATVDSIPLMVSSIMSKKLAAGSKNIVLDVKVGSGAFMKDLKDAEELAGKMVQIGRMQGRNVSAVLSDMNVPLGKNIGNALEVKESIEVLQGRDVPDLREVAVTLATELAKSFLGISETEARAKVNEAIDSGAALQTMKKWIKAQGGDESYVEHPEKFPEAAYKKEVLSLADGFVGGTDAEQIGLSAVILGAGRAAKGDSIDFAAGIVLLKKTGDAVKKGEPIAVLYTNKEESLPDAEKAFLAAYEFSDTKPAEIPLVYKIIR